VAGRLSPGDERATPPLGKQVIDHSPAKKDGEAQGKASRGQGSRERLLVC
jgi:hypothetical protein